MECGLHVGQIVEVLWDDASYWQEQVDLDDLLDSFLTLTYGIVVLLTDKSLFISSELQVENGSYRSTTRIPYSYIVGVKILSTLDDAGTPPRHIEGVL